MEDGTITHRIQTVRDSSRLHYSNGDWVEKVIANLPPCARLVGSIGEIDGGGVIVIRAPDGAGKDAFLHELESLPLIKGQTVWLLSTTNIVRKLTLSRWVWYTVDHDGKYVVSTTQVEL
jgi:hypothetical protein